MNIKLIAIDLDGTTLMNDHRSISPRTRRAITAALEKGITVVPATGRNDALLPDSIMEISGIRYVITANGAVTRDRKENKVLSTGYVPAPLAVEILEMLPRKEVLVEVFQNGRLVLERSFFDTLAKYPVDFLPLDFMRSISLEVDNLPEYIRSNGDKIEKINMPQIPQQWLNPLWDRMTAVKSVTISSSVRHNMEINYAGTTKGSALCGLCETLGIPRENVLAMGDNGNDIAMLEYAGFSAAMENGTIEAKAAANTVTYSSDEDGVAFAIEKYALNER